MPTNLTNETVIAMIAASWSNSRRRLDRQEEAEADQRASKLPKTLEASKHIEMRKALASEYYDNKVPEDKYLPSAT